jgi:hypothetical protein
MRIVQSLQDVITVFGTNLCAMSGKVADKAMTSDEEQIHIVVRQTRKSIECKTINGHKHGVVVTDLFGSVRERVKAFTCIECKFCIGGGHSFDQLTVRW